MFPINKFEFFGAALALSTSLFCSCASSEKSANSPAVASVSELTPVRVQLDWIYNAQFAGLFQAVEQGYYADVGFEVSILPGVGADEIKLGDTREPVFSFGSTESNVLIGKVAEGADAVAIGAMFQDSPMGWMYLKEGPIESFEDLVNVRVGIHADGARVIALLLEQQGVDASGLETFAASYDPQQLLDGKADALQCYYIDEFVKLEQMVGDRAGVFLARDYGYRAYSQVMYTSGLTATEHPQVVADFLAATKRGWEYAFAHQEATIDLILSKYNPKLERDYQIRSLAKVEELMVPEPGALFRPMDPEVLKAGQAHLLKYDLIPEAVDIDALLVQQYLP
ncbi:ABC transporter substrate-binding protein [Coraliomargarita algicola]|uniref:Thiamine pyrimidine synthase n=3 Tax=Coraliomargaritaceae TaxID=3056371 RepID=A0ABU1B075_9BACT|nr:MULTISPECIES: ABC transporter substrate-binding protein [unclassified Coraliomargarita]MDQ8193409.1 ABC transporter substrate-binding protein [Coraliomargarita sp. SDUM461004]MDQ8208775.1 ABC transporter substrate-binding protein [Coraliomargarita sp. SDUM461003]WPJ94585.1 ABC transporter substrate-binding protein [Coraliomargarita sp. J2-16]